MGEERKMYKVLMGKSQGKRLLRRRRWGVGFRMDLKEIGMMVCVAFNWLRTGTGGWML
jgi:hypothetical protein